LSHKEAAPLARLDAGLVITNSREPHKLRKAEERLTANLTLPLFTALDFGLGAGDVLLGKSNYAGRSGDPFLAFSNGPLAQRKAFLRAQRKAFLRLGYGVGRRPGQT
jgi:hypothetical protein